MAKGGLIAAALRYGGNVMVGGQKGDTLLGNGGTDVLRGGQGDEVAAGAIMSRGHLAK